MTLAGVVTEYVLPQLNSKPFVITTAPDGNLYFTEPAVNKIGRINLTTLPSRNGFHHGQRTALRNYGRRGWESLCHGKKPPTPLATLPLGVIAAKRVYWHQRSGGR